MGTGRLGGGGSGGSARGGGGASSFSDSSGSRLGYQFAEGKAKANDPDLAAAEEYVAEKLKKLPREYLELQFGNPFLNRVYKEIFYFKTEVVDGNSWGSLSARLGVGMGEGCLQDWIDKVVTLRKDEDFPQKKKILETVQVALEDFMISALKKDEEEFFSGDSKSVTDALRKKSSRDYFSGISEYFLSQMIWHVVDRERERLPAKVELRVREACEKKAHKIIPAFKKKFLHEQVGSSEKVTEQNLFSVFAANPQWLTSNF